MAWIMLSLAGLLEVLWAFSMKQSHGFTRPIPSAITLIAMAGSFFLLSASMKSLPLGTAYALWTGIGALGAFVVGVVALDEHVSSLRVLGVVLIASGLILMGLTTRAT